MAKREFGYLGKLGEAPTTRARSGKQESKIAKDLKGHKFINSGATFGQNDVFTDFCEIEAKTTLNESFSLKLDDWRKLKKKCSSKKLPIIVVDFERSEDSLAVLNYDDLVFLIEKANEDR
jgi:hypothetical protein